MVTKGSIVIIDDHPVFVKGLSQLIATQRCYEITGSAATRDEALALVADRKPDLAIVDLNLGDDDGFELIADLRRRFPDVKLLVLSMHDERYYAERALRLGASGYVMKEEAVTSVTDALRAVLSGGVWLSVAERARQAEFTDVGGKLASVASLSRRQREIFEMIGEGIGTADIALALGVSAKTIDTHKDHIKSKLHCESSQDLRHLAVEWKSRPESRES
jgi:two-component system, NarL family, response regulator NreC